MEKNVIVSELNRRLQNLDEIHGGLRVPLQLPWYYPIIMEEGQIPKDFRNPCIKTIHALSDFPEVSCIKKNECNVEIESIIYFPEQVRKLKLFDTLGEKFVQPVIKRYTAGKKHLDLLEKTALYSISRLKMCGKSIDAFVLNESAINFNWLNHYTKQTMIRGIADYLKVQTCLTSVSLSNTYLYPQVVLKLLFIFGYLCGEQIEYLNIVHFCKDGFFPKMNKEKAGRSLYDSFKLQQSDLEKPKEEELKLIWNQYIEKRIAVDIPKSQYDHVYKSSIKLFSNLKCIFVQYSFLCGDQGLILCYIGSVINNTLEELYLLCAPRDLCKHTGQKIHDDAWFVATSLCTQLKVHLILEDVISYNDVKTFFSGGMPLESIYINSGIRIKNVDGEMNNWDFGCTVKMLTTNYSYKLKVLNIHLWHSDEKLDVVICRCIRYLYLLEQFVYRGPFDKLDTLDELCRFIFLNPLRLKLFHLYVLEHISNAKAYQDATDQLYQTHRWNFMTKNIDFILTSCYF